jgi:hypothetical protein
MRAMMEETLLLAKAQLAGERQQAPIGALVQGEAAVLRAEIERVREEVEDEHRLIREMVHDMMEETKAQMMEETLLLAKAQLAGELRAEIEKATSCHVQARDSLKVFRSETEGLRDRLAALESTTDAAVQQLTADTGAAALSLANVERKLDALHRESNENDHRPSHPHEATVAQIANLSDDLERRIRQLESFMAYLEQTTKGGQHPQTPKTASANAGRNSKDGHLHPPRTPRATALAPGDGSMGPPKTPHSLAKLHARRMSVTFASESISETGELGSIALAPLSVGMKLSSLEHDLQLMKLEQSDKLRSLREFDSFSDAVLKASSTQDLRDVLEREAQSSQNWRHEFEQRILAVDEEMTCVRLQVDELYQWLTEQPQLADSDSEAGDSSIFASIESWFD